MYEMLVSVPKEKIAKGQPLEDLAFTALKQGAKARGTVGGITTYENINAYEVGNYDDFTLTSVAAVVGLGGEVQGYAAWIKITNASASTPTYLPNSVITGDDDVSRQKTWAEWEHPNLPSTVLSDGNTYLTTTFVAGGRTIDFYKNCLSGTIISQLIADSYTIINLKTFQELRPDTQP
jgi:hypothetical protein